MKLKQWGQISDLRQDKHKFFIEFPFTEKRACFACRNPAIANLNSVPKYTDDGHQEVAREHENDGGWFQTNELKRYDGHEAECDLCINRKFTCFGTLFSKINHFDLFQKRHILEDASGFPGITIARSMLNNAHNIFNTASLSSGLFRFHSACITFTMDWNFDGKI